MPIKIKVTDGTHRIAVYGTLKYGHGNHRNYLRKAQYLGDAYVHDVGIIDMVGFPIAVPLRGVRAKVEVYDVNDVELNMVDGLEGHPHWYRRVEVDTVHGKAWMYLQEFKQMVNQIEDYGLVEDWQ